jgi:hypothetical protein
MNQLDANLIIITSRADSPLTTITSSSQSNLIHSTTLYSTVQSALGNNNINNINNSINNTNNAINGQYKGNNLNEQQNKNRICRDFVRGACRRLYCKVRMHSKILA